MKQVIQRVAGGSVEVVDVPRPTIQPTEILVQTLASVISPGTERAVTELARSSLLAKARARPDLVRQVIKKARAEGVSSATRAVKARLDSDLPLGYSAAGRVVEVGAAVEGISPGDIVATAGAGKANHAEYQAVPALLAAPVPAGVEVEDAAFGTLCSIVLHGLRLSEVDVGGRVVFVGLGLLGQLGIRLARASGMDVFGIDVSEDAVQFARANGATASVDAGDVTTEEVLRWSSGLGADAVVITAADRSSKIIERTPSLCRDRARVVVVGDVGLNISRTPFYEKEIQLVFARSYGPGRYDISYEEWGVDYPAGYVRWTEGRNLSAVLALMASGRLRVSDLVTHRFDIAEATQAYKLIEGRNERYMAIQIAYPREETPPREIRLRKGSRGFTGVGLIGAGSFARSVLIPSLKEAGFERLVSVASASGLSARSVGEKSGFEKLANGPSEVIADPDVEVVVIATPHDSHARLAAEALRAGKHVFCEKPLALTEEELDEVQEAWAAGDSHLFVGFNRRWSPAVAAVRSHLEGVSPQVITYRVNAAPVPRDHWYNDRRHGGRLLGEVCHFIDTCAAIVGMPAETVTAAGSGNAELLLADQIVVTLGYGDGSLATISYATTGHRSTEKERVEVLGGGRTATIEDFRGVILDGTIRRSKTQDKGHAAQLRAFRDVLSSTEVSHTQAFLDSSRTTLHAAAKLLRQS